MFEESHALKSKFGFINFTLATLVVHYALNDRVFSNNTPGPSNAPMCEGTASLVQVMARRLCSEKPLPKPTMALSELNSKFSEMRIVIPFFHVRNMI